MGDLGREHCFPRFEIRDDGEKLGSFLGWLQVEIVLLHDAFGVPRLKGGIAHAPMKGDVVGDEAMAGLIVGEIEMSPGLLHETVEVDGEDWPIVEGLEPFRQ